MRYTGTHRPHKHTSSWHTFSAISCEWCSECSLSRNMRCCSLLASLQVSHVDSVQLLMPRHARDMMAKWRERMASGRLTSARTNWKFRIPLINPQMQQEENNIIWERKTYIMLAVCVCVLRAYNIQIIMHIECLYHQNNNIACI